MAVLVVLIPILLVAMINAHQHGNLWAIDFVENSHDD